MTTNNPKSSIIYLIAAMVVAFIVRMLSYASVTANGGISFRGYDDFYHMRLITYAASNFPHFLNFDSYINYPYGFEIGWPPFFDLLGALLAKVLGGGQPDLHAVEFAGALLPVLLGVLTIIPLYVVSSAILDRKTGLLAAFIFAILPAHIYISYFGLADHHVAEALLTTASYAFFILSLKSAREESLSLASLKNIFSEKKLLKPIGYAGASGLFLALFIYTWVGALAFIGLIVLYAFIQAIFDLKTEKKSDYLFICSITCLLATFLFTIPLSAGAVRPGLEMSAMYLSWFQVFFTLSMIVGTILIWGVSEYVSKKGLDWKYYPAVIILVFGGGLLALRIFSAESYAFVISGINFFFGKGEYLGTISEAMPLFFTSGKLDIMQAYYAFGLSLLIALGALFLLGLEWNKDKSKPEGLFFLVWAIFSMYLVLSQRRFAYQLSVSVAILTSYMVWVLLESFDFENEIRKLMKSERKTGKDTLSALKTGKEARLGKEPKLNTKSKMKTKNMPLSIKVEQPDYFKIVTSLALIGLVFIPCVWFGVSFARGSGSLDPAWEESLVWLKNSSPETSYYLQPSKTPEYGVLSWWDYGNWIVYISKRPAIANNFQTGVNDSAHFFMTDSEQEAKAIMDKLKVKYVITDTQMANGKFGAIAQLAGKNIGDYYDFNAVGASTGSQTVATAKKALSNVELYKLHDLNGAYLGNLRLIHESNIPNAANIVKVFEYVPGARLSGTTSPNQLVTATISIKSNTGSQFTYQNNAVADKNGLFEITVPYSTENTGREVSAISAYSLNIGGNAAVTGIQVKESDVLNGNRVEVKNL
jgi:dolichyl-phosphooligosaccharide-protein glycotransferase